MPRKIKRQKVQRHQTAKDKKSKATTNAKKRKKRKKEGKSDREEDKQVKPLTTSPLVYDPEVVLQELLLRHPDQLSDDEEESLEDIRAQLFERQKAFVKHQSVKIRTCLSKKICRFELPMDFKELEALCPQTYLKKYCCVCQRRRNAYLKVFRKFDNRQKMLLSFKDMENALNDLYLGNIDSKQFQWLMDLCDVQRHTEIDSNLFCSICALSERLLYANFVIVDMEDADIRQKDLLEEADFCSLPAKLSGYNIAPALTRLLLQL